MVEDRTRIVAGCMTGTSLDGLDVALVKIIGTGLDMRAELLGHHALQIADDLHATLLSLASGEAHEPLVYMRAARALGELHADGIEALLAGGLAPPLESAPPPIDFITAHGQTIWHAPGSRASDRDDDHAGMSWQLFDPWPIVKRLNVPVCYDLRQADLIAGGEGAPLTPIADWVMYRGKAAVVYNLGGIANSTWLAGGWDELFAEDLSPCNILLDGLIQRLIDVPFDRDGACARQGKLNREVMQKISSAVLLQIPDHLSLGRELFPDEWFEDLLADVRPMAPVQDIMRSAVYAIAIDICRPLDTLDGSTLWDDDHEHTIVLAGGGARNQALVDEMCENMNPTDPEEELNYRYKMTLSDDLGIPCEAREAMGFAVLGALSQDGIPISLPRVTGATDPGVAGVWAYA